MACSTTIYTYGDSTVIHDTYSVSIANSDRNEQYDGDWFERILLNVPFQLIYGYEEKDDDNDDEIEMKRQVIFYIHTT